MTMKKSIYTLLALALMLTSCDSWVENAGTPSNTLTKEQLNKSAMIAIVQTNTISDGPLTAYVKTLQGDAASAAFLALGTTVDELTEGQFLMLSLPPDSNRQPHSYIGNTK